MTIEIRRRDGTTSTYDIDGTFWNRLIRDHLLGCRCGSCRAIRDAYRAEWGHDWPDEWPLDLTLEQLDGPHLSEL